MNINEAILSRLDSIEGVLKGIKEKPLTLEEASNYLDCSKSYLYKLTASGQIPHYKPNGKRVFFAKKDLDDYILRNPVRTNAQIEVEATRRSMSAK
jgi:excisionase family DNA binding protein